MEVHLPTFAAETLFHIGPLAVTNTIINSWIALLIFVILGLTLRRTISLKPGNLQNGIEYFLEIVLGYFDQVTGDRKKTLRFLPLVGSVFCFILLSNWLGLIPGTGSITLHGEPLLRSANTDLNLTVAMAIIAVISSHIFGLITVGFFTHLNKFIQLGTLVKSFRKGPIAVFTAVIEVAVGFIEIVSEMAKVISLSLRLFGNIFAGEVLMAVISGIISILLPTPFMMLELLVGVIQAAVFSILTLVYLTVATAEVHAGEH